jgi:hypothetical protein
MAGRASLLRGASSKGAVVALLLMIPAMGIEQLPLTMPGAPGTQGELMGPGQKMCYNLTLSDNAVKEVVWWEQAKLILRLEPCVGKPHLLVSVYGCPSDGGRVVWEYMSPKMRNDLVAQGKTLPAEWEWVGDVEALTIELTHRTYYIEVVHQMEPYSAIDGQNTVAKFRLEAHLIDKVVCLPWSMPSSAGALVLQLHDALTSACACALNLHSKYAPCRRPGCL